MTISPADSTLVAIRKKVRRLTASASESALTTPNIDQYINTYYSQDFPYGIKIDQMRSVYTFFTEPYRDRYPLDVNYNQGVRSPMYVEGIQGTFMKDRQQFFNVWPRYPTLLNQGEGTVTTITGIITGIAQPTNPASVTSVAHGLNSNSLITISGVTGMVQINGIWNITVVDADTFTLNGVDNTTFGAYTGGGTWTSTSVLYQFTLPAPFLSKEVVLGGTDTYGNPISINDDGNGNLILKTPNPVVSVPVATTNPALPGMYNLNTANPGLINPLTIGTVNYVTGVFDFSLNVQLESGTQLTTWTSQYQTGRPYSLLFWNNEFTIRPVPKHIHKVEVETYLTPTQFLETSDVPILNQWWQLIAIGAAIKVLEDRQDMDGVQNLSVLYDRQEDLVLERQGVEELFQPNVQLFNQTTTGYGGVGGVGYY